MRAPCLRASDEPHTAQMAERPCPHEVRTHQWSLLNRSRDIWSCFGGVTIAIISVDFPIIFDVSAKIAETPYKKGINRFLSTRGTSLCPSKGEKHQKIMRKTQKTTPNRGIEPRPSR
ncbi:uncharacterized protein VTP21DRAFT_9231 [Calcarisporiella thermophila]|uniref:uncharacterized protein n=1 Tax=Calcarisporiella thermophila TaxID=911321 RepID=UPI0037429111